MGTVLRFYSNRRTSLIWTRPERTDQKLGANHQGVVGPLAKPQTPISPYKFRYIAVFTVQTALYGARLTGADADSLYELHLWQLK